MFPGEMAGSSGAKAALRAFLPGHDETNYAAFARATSALYIASSSPSACAMLGRCASRAT